MAETRVMRCPRGAVVRTAPRFDPATKKVVLPLDLDESERCKKQAEVFDHPTLKATLVARCPNPEHGETLVNPLYWGHEVIIKP
jgi:hypothetical protein